MELTDKDRATINHLRDTILPYDVQREAVYRAGMIAGMERCAAPAPSAATPAPDDWERAMGEFGLVPLPAVSAPDDVAALIHELESFCAAALISNVSTWGRADFAKLFKAVDNAAAMLRRLSAPAGEDGATWLGATRRAEAAELLAQQRGERLDAGCPHCGKELTNDAQ